MYRHRLYLCLFLALGFYGFRAANKTGTASLTVSLRVVNNKPLSQTKLSPIVTITNTGKTGCQLWCWELDYANLCFDVVDAKGETVYALSPPVPPTEAERRKKIRTIKSGTHTELHYGGLAIDDTYLVKGKYKMQFNATVPTGADGKTSVKLVSNWVAFEMI